MLKKAYLIFLFLGIAISDIEASSTPEQKIEEITKIFYARPDLRHASERIQVRENRARLSVWYDLPPNPNRDQIECLSYRWLLGGRGQRLGAGASEIFKQIPSLDVIELELFELDFRTATDDGRGRLKRSVEKRPYARAAVTRSNLESTQLSPQEWKEKLWEGLTSCIRLGRATEVRREILW